MERIHKKLWILLQFRLVPPGPIFGMKFTISCEFSPLRVKWWYHMFSSIKMEEYMESELSGIFQLKLVTKNIVRGSPGTQFMHMRVKWDSPGVGMLLVYSILVVRGQMIRTWKRNWWRTWTEIVKESSEVAGVGCFSTITWD